MEPADQGDRFLLRLYAEVRETRLKLFVRSEVSVAPPEAVLQGDEPGAGLFVEGVEADGVLQRGGRGVALSGLLVQFGEAVAGVEGTAVEVLPHRGRPRASRSSGRSRPRRH